MGVKGEIEGGGEEKEKAIGHRHAVMTKAERDTARIKMQLRKKNEVIVQNNIIHVQNKVQPTILLHPSHYQSFIL